MLTVFWLWPLGVLYWTVDDLLGNESVQIITDFAAFLSCKWANDLTSTSFNWQGNIFSTRMQCRILIFFLYRTASLSNFCIRSSFSMLQLHSGGMHHEQWWVWLQDGGKAIDALMHGITISASVSRKQKEMIVDFRRDGNSQPTCTLDEQLWEWSPALEVPENLNWSYNTSFLVKKTHQCLCFYNIQGAAVYKQSTGIRPGRDYHDFIEQTVSFLIN